MIVGRNIVAKGSALAGRRLAASSRAFSSSAPSGDVVPVIDFGRFLNGNDADRKAVSQQVGDACENIGFLVLENHCVPDDVIQSAWTATRGFFDLPVEVKETYTSVDQSKYPYGYDGFGAEDLAAGLDKEAGVQHVSTPDLKECFSMGPYNPASGMPPPRLPTQPPEFADAWMAYYKSMETLSSQLLRCFALALELEENWFEDKIDRHRCALRALNYPDLETPPLPGQLRASAHTDYGSLTILRPDDAPGGLQVMPRSGEWVDVAHIPDAYIINLGDLMSRWTNDKWVSTLHRVVPPPMDAGRSCRRQSMAFFHNINADHVVECIPTCKSDSNPAKYPPITAFDHLMEKHLASIGGEKK